MTVSTPNHISVSNSSLSINHPYNSPLHPIPSQSKVIKTNNYKDRKRIEFTRQIKRIQQLGWWAYFKILLYGVLVGVHREGRKQPPSQQNRLFSFLLKYFLKVFFNFLDVVLIRKRFPFHTGCEFDAKRLPLCLGYDGNTIMTNIQILFVDCSALVSLPHPLPVTAATIFRLFYGEENQYDCIPKYLMGAFKFSPCFPLNNAIELPFLIAITTFLLFQTRFQIIYVCLLLLCHFVYFSFL